MLNKHVFMFLLSADICIQYLRVKYCVKNGTEVARLRTGDIKKPTTTSEMHVVFSENCVFPVWRAELFITKHFSIASSFQTG